MYFSMFRTNIQYASFTFKMMVYPKELCPNMALDTSRHKVPLAQFQTRYLFPLEFEKQLFQISVHLSCIEFGFI